MAGWDRRPEDLAPLGTWPALHWTLAITPYSHMVILTFKRYIFFLFKLPGLCSYVCIYKVYLYLHIIHI